MTAVMHSDTDAPIRAIVFLPSGRPDCVAVARMPFEDYLRLDVDGLAEWVDGEVRLYMSVSRSHQRIVDFLNRLIGLFIEFQGGGELRSAPFAMRATLEGSGREPDLLYVRPEHLQHFTGSHFAGAPDLAVEVVSQDGLVRDYVEKFREYEAAGIPEYWVIDSRPGYERVDFFVLRDGHYIPELPVDGIFRSTVVDGFWLKVEWLWDPEPRASSALQEILGRPLV